MSWFRLDDQGAFHAKVIEAGNEAYGAWCRAGQWCSAQLTDGLIPMDVALTIGPKRLWDRLVKARLCERDGPTRVRIHDFLEYNPSASKIVAERARKAKNIADYRYRARSVTGNASGYEPVSLPPGNHRPDPDPDPDPKFVKTTTLKRNRGGNRLPPDWEATPAEIATVTAEHGITPAEVSATLPRFRDYWLAQPGQRGVKLDWPATFRNWLRREAENGKIGGHFPKKPDPEPVPVQPWLIADCSAEDAPKKDFAAPAALALAGGEKGGLRGR